MFLFPWYEFLGVELLLWGHTYFKAVATFSEQLAGRFTFPPAVRESVHNQILPHVPLGKQNHPQPRPSSLEMNDLKGQAAVGSRPFLFPPVFWLIGSQIWVSGQYTILYTLYVLGKESSRVTWFHPFLSWVLSREPNLSLPLTSPGLPRSPAVVTEVLLAQNLSGTHRLLLEGPWWYPPVLNASHGPGLSRRILRSTPR